MAIIGTDSIGRPVRRAATDTDRLIGGPIRRFAIFISTRLDQRAERRRLQSLSDHMLKDMGVSRCDVEREARAGWFGR